MVISELFTQNIDPSARTQIAADWLDQIDGRVPRSLTGVVRFELAKVLIELSAGVSEHLLEHAAALFRNAVGDLNASRLASCADSAERRLKEVEEAIIARRQGRFAFLETPTHPVSADWHIPRLGLGVHRLLCMALPTLPLFAASAGVDEGSGAQRKHLFSIPTDHALLRRLLPNDLTILRGSVAFGKPRRGARSGSEGVRLRLGRETSISALLDGEFHQLIGMPSNGDGREVTVFVDSNGLDIVPERKQGWVGKPIGFEARGGQAGVHDVRFTFLTHERVVSKLQRRVEVLDF
jgi:hypothetical protein